MMSVMRLEAAVILGIATALISSVSLSSPTSDCLADVDTCMSDLCQIEQLFYRGICKDEGCQMKGSDVCNMTIQTVLDRFPSLPGCVCAWEEALCGSIQELAKQCHQKPVSQHKKRTLEDWESSTLIDDVYDGAGSCLERVTVCVGDAVCNRYLVPLLQACMGEECDEARCQQVTRQFYGNMPSNVAEMLVMCECEASDHSCVHMKTGLHSGTCGDETWICQHALSRCVEDATCRSLLKTFHTKCWTPEEAQCSDSPLWSTECFTRMDPALLLGADSDCKTAFLATLGQVLLHPCTCEGVHQEDLQVCNMIHHVFHNRSRFITAWKNPDSPLEYPGMNESEQSYAWSQDYLLYAFTAMLLVGVVIVMPVVVVSKIWLLRRRDKTKFHQPEKGHCVVIGR